jgi:hypothetical protein
MKMSALCQLLQCNVVDVAQVAQPVPQAGQNSPGVIILSSASVVCLVYPTAVLSFASPLGYMVSKFSTNGCMVQDMNL